MTGSVPSTWDGTSFKQLLFNVSTPVREYSLIQYFGESQELEMCGSLPGYLSAPCDQWNNTYSCLRTVTLDGTQNDIYCTFSCFNNAHELVACPADLPEGYGEYYNMITDPFQTQNMMLQLQNKQWYEERLASLITCSGQAQCGLSL